MSKTRRKSSAAVQSPLETYLREINETALLSPGDEHDLAVSIGLGNVEARDRMVRANLRLVVNIARGYTGKGLGLQDLIEEGNLGLLRAVEGFDPAMGTRFSTYASYWIKQSIKRALINTAKTIRIPAYMVELLSKWRRASTRLADELGRTPTPEEIARVLGLPRKKLPIIKKAIRIYNLTPQTDQAETGWSLSEMVMDEQARNPDEEMLENDNVKHVFQQLRAMDTREATVLRMRFGLDDNEPRTLKEIGESLGLTRERVRQIETEALNKLSQSLEEFPEMPQHGALRLSDYIRSIPDFPKPGILFRDITPLLADAGALRQAVAELAGRFRGRGVSLVAAAEARGFIFAAPLAIELGAGLIPIRKPGKLPYQCLSHSYDLEYGSGTLQIHSDAIPAGARVLVVDDLLATGGTVDACCRLVELCGGEVVGCAFVIELVGLGGARHIARYETFSLIKYD